MGQLEILNFLKEQHHKDKNRWFTSTEILEGIKEGGHIGGENRIHICLMRLSTYKLIKFKGMGVWNHRKIFKYK